MTEPKPTNAQQADLAEWYYDEPDPAGHYAGLDGLRDLVARMVAAAEQAARAEALADGWDEGLRFGTRYGASDTGDPYLASNPYRSAS